MKRSAIFIMIVVLAWFCTVLSVKFTVTRSNTPQPQTDTLYIETPIILSDTVRIGEAAYTRRLWTVDTSYSQMDDNRWIQTITFRTELRSVK